MSALSKKKHWRKEEIFQCGKINKKNVKICGIFMVFEYLSFSAYFNFTNYFKNYFEFLKV
jgi:hypothetical protein